MESPDTPTRALANLPSWVKVLMAGKPIQIPLNEQPTEFRLPPETQRLIDELYREESSKPAPCRRRLSFSWVRNCFGTPATSPRRHTNQFPEADELSVGESWKSRLDLQRSLRDARETAPRAHAARRGCAFRLRHSVYALGGSFSATTTAFLVDRMPILWLNSGEPLERIFSAIWRRLWKPIPVII